MPQTTALGHILKSLRSPDLKVRESSKEALSKLLDGEEPLTPAEGLEALRAASGPFPFDQPGPDELSEFLVDLAGKEPRPEYVPVIVSSYGKLGEEARTSALGLLARLKGRDAAVAIMRILELHAEAGRVPGLVNAPLEAEPRHADVFFPALFRYARVPKLADDVYRLCLAYCQAGLLQPEALAPHADQVVAAYRILAEKLRPAQRDGGVAWMWEDDYAESRFPAGLLLDLLGYFPALATEIELQRALEFRDPRLKAFAVASLLRQGRTVNESTVSEVVAHAEMRNYLYDELRRRGKLALFPERHRTQEALAESDMVSWLTFPTELGQVPDEIQLMKVVPIDTGLPGGVYDYFVFRFRTHEPHWAAKDGWMAGISGPFARAKEPTTEALGETFSKFERWESKRPEEHVGDLQELMEEWREYHRRPRE